MRKDSNTFGGKFEPYKINGIELNHINKEGFITLKGSPIIEKLRSKFCCINEAVELLNNGRTFSESYDYEHPNHLSVVYNTHKKFLNYDMNNLLR